MAHSATPGAAQIAHVVTVAEELTATEPFAQVTTAVEIQVLFWSVKPEILSSTQ